MSDKNDMKEYLAAHPKMIGALFTLVLLASQAGSALAANGSGFHGP
ncbi:DUF7503 family protein [Halegenticoccus tardaugens]|nr:hypothetical protein [Halegenticoccus tardaugens]